jgi:hypothetical protein
MVVRVETGRVGKDPALEKKKRSFFFNNIYISNLNNKITNIFTLFNFIFWFHP